MKPLFSLGLALLAIVPARAQLFGPNTINGAFLGGIAGAVIGHNSGSLSHNGWQGAAIGAGAGALLGSISDASAPRYDDRVPIFASSAGYGFGGYGVERTPVSHDGYYYGSAAYGGLWLGGAAGGIIGHNHGGNWRHNGWRGAAWGAGAGFLLGSILDASQYDNRCRYGDEYAVGGIGFPAYYGYPRTVVTTAFAPAPALPQTTFGIGPQQIKIVNNFNGNAAPMAQANALFGRN